MTKATITLAAQAVTLIQPSSSMRIGYIQNNGSNEARLTFDGSDPTASKGFKLPSGIQVWLQQIYGSALAGAPAPWPAVRGYSDSGTSIDVGTDDAVST